MTSKLRISCTVLAVALLAASAPVLAANGSPGAVYVATNAADGNAVMAFARRANGRLDDEPQLFPTGGLGTGTGLGNQGGVVLSSNRRLLFVVNAGSDDVSVFRVRPQGLRLLSVTPSGGERPVSVTQHRRLLYVLNAGGAVGGEDAIAGFRIQPRGQLEFLDGSVQPLSGTSTGPAQVGFSPTGAALIVTEKATHMVTTFLVDDDGVAGPPLPQASIGQTPFGFGVARRDLVLVSEAFGGASGASTVTAYRIDGDGLLEVVAPSVPTTETAACWVAVSKDGRFAYTTNTGSGTVSGFAIDWDGGLTLLDADGVTGMAGAGPIDMDFSEDGRFLYTLDAGDDSITAFRHRTGSGALKPRQTLAGLPDAANGLAAR
jgi:6-phosphogluconolactonase (cycloisomerase 2 family)